MDTAKMPEEIDDDRRRFVGTAAMTIAAGDDSASVLALHLAELDGPGDAMERAREIGRSRR